jgi:hypothetical protein
MLCMRMVRCCAHVSSACAWCAAARMVPLLAHAHGMLLRACVWCLRMHMACCCADVLSAWACAGCAAVCIFLVRTHAHGVLLRVSSADVGKIVGQCSLRDTFLEVRKWIPGEGFCRAAAQFAACCGSLKAVSSLYNGCKCGVRHRGMRMSAQTAAPWLCQSAQGGNVLGFTTVLDCLVNGCG